MTASFKPKCNLRPVRMWIPDCYAPNFRESIRQQIRQIDVADEKDAQDFIDRVAADSADS